MRWFADASLTVVERSAQLHAIEPKVSAYGDILKSTLASDDLSTSMIGCAAHCVHFYITTQLFFLPKRLSTEIVAAINKSRNCQKLTQLSVKFSLTVTGV